MSNWSTLMLFALLHDQAKDEKWKVPAIEVSLRLRMGIKRHETSQARHHSTANPVYKTWAACYPILSSHCAAPFLENLHYNLKIVTTCLLHSPDPSIVSLCRSQVRKRSGSVSARSMIRVMSACPNNAPPNARDRQVRVIKVVRVSKSGQVSPNI
jgi:hypothetical protein